MLAESVAPSTTIQPPVLKLRVLTRQPFTRTRLLSLDSARDRDSCTRAGDLTGQDLLLLELPSRLAMVRLLSASTGDNSAAYRYGIGATMRWVSSLGPKGVGRAVGASVRASVSQLHLLAGQHLLPFKIAAANHPHTFRA